MMQKENNLQDHNYMIKFSKGEFMEKDLLMLYRNYIFALQTRKEFGEKYGDTDEIIKQYEEKLKIKSLSGEKNGKKRL